jgi:hypothetical protein
VGLVTSGANFSCDFLSLNLSGFSSYRICELVVSLKGFLSASASNLQPVRNAKTRGVTLQSVATCAQGAMGLVCVLRVLCRFIRGEYALNSRLK